MRSMSRTARVLKLFTESILAEHDEKLRRLERAHRAGDRDATVPYLRALMQRGAKTHVELGQIHDTASRLNLKQHRALFPRNIPERKGDPYGHHSTINADDGSIVHITRLKDGGTQHTFRMQRPDQQRQDKELRSTAHREDGPAQYSAVYHPNGETSHTVATHYHDGDYHRDGGPAITSRSLKNGEEIWRREDTYRHGRRTHRRTSGKAQPVE